MALTVVTVSATYKNPDGSAASGSVRFRLTRPILDGSGNVIVAQSLEEATLDVNGSISVPLYATSGTGLLPANNSYEVEEFITGASPRRNKYKVILPDTDLTPDLADYSPTSALPTYEVNGVSSVVAGPGIAVDSTDPHNPVVSATGGGGGTGTVDSVVAGPGVSVNSADPANPIVTAEVTQLELDAEATARASADTALDGRLDVIEAISIATDAELATEAATRAAADTALDTRVDTLEALPEVTAGTDIDVVGGVVSVGTGPVRRSEYSAGSILIATADNDPQPEVVGISRLVGRGPTGDVGSLTPLVVRGMLDLELFKPGSCDPRLVEATLTATANRAYYQRNVFGNSAGATGLYVHIGVQSGNICVAVYENDGGVGRLAKPGAQKGTSGSVACPAVGINLVSFTAPVDIYPGDWLCVVADNGTVSFGRMNSTAMTDFDGWAWQQAAAFPAPATATPASTISALWLASD